MSNGTTAKDGLEVSDRDGDTEHDTKQTNATAFCLRSFAAYKISAELQEEKERENPFNIVILPLFFNYVCFFSA